MQEKITNFVIFPRYLREKFLSKNISRDGFVVCAWLRLGATLYGKATANLSSLDEDLFYNRKGQNQMNQILLELKKQRLLFYWKRSGSRGSFDVYFGDFIHPYTKQIIKLDKYFEAENTGRKSIDKEEVDTELSQSFVFNSKSFESKDDEILSIFSALSENTKVRGGNNDTNTKTKTNRSRKGVDRKPIYTELFQPKSLEQAECLKIATEIGENKMNYLLSILERYGYDPIETAFAEFKGQVNDSIRNRPAFFNSKVTETLEALYPSKRGESQKI
jgi:hypothetical protein